MKQALATGVIATTLLCGCNAVFGLDELLPLEGQGGGPGGAGAGGASGGGDAGGQGGATGGNGGGGGTGLGPLTCTAEHNRRIAVEDSGAPPWRSALDVVEVDRVLRVVIGAGDHTTLYHVDPDQTGPVDPLLHFPGTFQHAERLDTSQIGILYSREDQPSEGLYIRQLRDNDSNGNTVVTQRLDTPVGFPTPDNLDLSARFLPNGNGGGFDLGDVRWAATYLDEGSGLYQAMFGLQSGEVQTNAHVFADEANTKQELQPQLMFEDGDDTHLFTGDFPVPHHYTLADGGTDLVPPLTWSMPGDDPALGTGAVGRSYDGSLLVSLVRASVSAGTLELLLAKLPDGGYAASMLDDFVTASTITDETLVVPGLGGSRAHQRWVGDNHVQLGAPLGDATDLNLSIHHVSGLNRANVTWNIGSDFGLTGLEIRNVAFAAVSPQLFGAVAAEGTILAILDVELNDENELHLVSISCAP